VSGAIPFALFPRRRVPVILQAEAAECGLACLAMIASYHGFETDLTSLRMRMSASLRGLTLAQLMKMGSAIRLVSRALRLEPASLKHLSLPCILHWDMDHFVVLEGVSDKKLSIVDPARGRLSVPLADASKHFTGIALEVSPAPDFQGAREKQALRLKTFFRGLVNLPATVGKLFLLSLTLNAFAVAAPLMTQLVVDSVIAGQDLQLLTLLACAFGALAITGAAIQGLRSFTVLYFGSQLQAGWAARLFHHLVRLPLSYFEKRHLGDILSRYRSLGAIQGVVTTTLVETVIDGLMATLTLALMIAYAPGLTIVSLVAIALYCVVRYAFYTPQRGAANEALVQSAKEESHFLESLRGILAIKSFSREYVREAQWQTRVTDSIRARQTSLSYATWQQFANQVIFAVENVLVIWLAAAAVIDGHFSIGMLVAFLSYKAMLTSRATALVDRLLDIRLLSVPLERLSDIVLSEREAIDETAALDAPPIRGRLEVRDLSFRYASTESDVVRGANLVIEPGECIAISSPSGSGKTTFLKLLMGLLSPDEGSVIADGRPIHRGEHLVQYRRQIAAVMQEDCLLSGTLLDNIAFFEAKPDREFVTECARLACIHDDIMAMPMGYATLVGDMGASLSGGQRQRVLLARALYARPRILFLDEATSHVDVATEQRIHRAIAAQRITRIMVTHRRETTHIADRIIEMDAIQPTTVNPSLSRVMKLEAS
jgi:ATP-binding cassette subfamily B protein RaxB